MNRLVDCLARHLKNAGSSRLYSGYWLWLRHRRRVLLSSSFNPFFFTNTHQLFLYLLLHFFFQPTYNVPLCPASRLPPSGSIPCTVTWLQIEWVKKHEWVCTRYQRRRLSDWSTWQHAGADWSFLRA